MAGGSLLLMGLQWRWTGEVADAELRLLRDGLGDSSQRLVDAMNQELGEPLNARSLAREASGEAIAKVFEEQSVSDESSRLYRQVALALPTGAGLDLYLKDIANGTMTAKADWPVSWQGMKEDLEAKRRGRPKGGHYKDASGMIVEVPIFGERKWGGRGRGGKERGGRHWHDYTEGMGSLGEKGWLIGETNADYVRKQWLPQLIETHYGIRGKSLHTFQVRANYSSNAILYTNSVNSVASLGVPDVSLDLRNRWTVEVWRRPGAAEAVVSQARWRNFILGGVLTALILAAGTFLVQVTRKRREVAAEQMRFVANVSHELRTPLTVIRGAAHNLKSKIVKDAERVTHYAGLIDRNAHELSEMVNQVLTLTKSDQTKSFSSVSVMALLKDAIESCEGRISEASCSVEWTELPNQSDPYVMADSLALTRVFRNLILNAAKHGGAGEWIGIGISTEGATVRVMISDRGPGIPKREQSRIFEPFFRGEDAEREQRRGSGLGLSLVAETIEAHRGNVAVESEIGKGTTFTVTLPVVPA